MGLLQDLYIKSNIKNINFIDPRCSLGICYVGSKNRIAKELMQEMYKRTPYKKFYDVFGGGGAMSHYATLAGFDVHYNDLNSEIYTLFDFLIKGNKVEGDLLEFCNINRFKKIVKEKNHNIKDILDLFIYTYAGAGEQYYTNKDTAWYHGNLHNMIFHNDNKSARNLDKRFGVDFFSALLKDSNFIKIDYINKAKRLSRLTRNLYIIEKFNLKEREELKNIVDFNNVHYFLNSSDLLLLNLVNKVTSERYSTLGHIVIENVATLKHLQRLNRIVALYELKDYNNIRTTNLSYDEIEYKKDSIIYCDIPYYKAFEYRENFDFDKFWAWAIKMARDGYNIYISELWMPEDRFQSIWQKKIVNKVSPLTTNIDYVEKLFIPKLD